MKNKFVKDLYDILVTPKGNYLPTAVWEANNLIDYYEEKLGIEISKRFKENNRRHNKRLMDMIIRIA